MAVAGHGSTISIGGTSTPAAAEATTCLDPGTYTKYRVTLAARRFMDVEGASVVVKKNAVVQAVGLYTLNPLFGTITFLSPLLVGDAVTVDYNYVGVSPIAEVRSYGISLARTVLDKTSVDSGGAKKKLAGLRDASGTVAFLSLIDATIAGTDLLAEWEAGLPLLLEIVMSAAVGGTFRAYALIEAPSENAAVDGLVEGALSWQATSVVPANAGQKLTLLAAFDDTDI